MGRGRIPKSESICRHAVCGGSQVIRFTNRATYRPSTHCSDLLLLCCHHYLIGTASSVSRTLRIYYRNSRTLWRRSRLTAYDWQVPDRLAASGTRDRRRRCFHFDVFHRNSFSRLSYIVRFCFDERDVSLELARSAVDYHRLSRPATRL